MNRRSFFALSILALIAIQADAAAADKPRLVVQIVVSQMRYDYLERFGDQFSEKGFRRFQNEGITFTDARLGYMATTTPAGLATLTTGAMPATHGVIGEQWVDFLTGSPVELTRDPSAMGLGTDAHLGHHSPLHLVAPTLGDRLLETSPQSKVVTLAASPASAVVMGGFTSNVFWVDQTRGQWSSSSHYMRALPTWVDDYNRARPADAYLGAPWELAKHREQYVNRRYSVVKLIADTRFKPVTTFSKLFNRDRIERDYPAIYATPAGNALVADFARQALIQNELGADEHTDLLNICFDSPRIAGEIFGPESMEIEDMIYRLDDQIGALVEFIVAQVPREKLLVVLTSDHGASDSYDRAGQTRDRFNVPQFKVIVNGFCNAQWGSGDWVLGYTDGQLYLNHNLVYQKGLSLQEVQHRVAAFVLQFRGVSHAMTAQALGGNSFSSGYGAMMQNSFYPRRSGDVAIDLMPGWIEERERIRSLPGSMYDYDTHVPLMLLSGSHGVMRIRSPVDLTQLAPTLARLMHISRPVAATGHEIVELTENLEY